MRAHAEENVFVIDKLVLRQEDQLVYNKTAELSHSIPRDAPNIWVP